VLGEWVPNDHITLEKNPAYWNAGEVGIERIEFKIIPDSARQLTGYEEGDLQVAEFPAGETARIQADPTFAKELQVLVRPGTSYLGLNTQVTPTTDINFRRAVASAIDRQALINEVLKQPWHKPAQVIVPPGISGYQGDDPTTGYAYNPEAARQYLAQAGYGEGNPPPPVEIWFNREGNNEVLFKAIGDMLERVGIPVRLTSSSWNVYRDALDACNKPNRPDAPKKPGECTYNLYRMGWVMDYADPSGILDVVFGPKSAFQYTGWQSDEYQTLLEQARAEQNETQRAALYQQAEKLLLNGSVAVVPLQYYDRTVLVKDGVKFDYPPFGAPNLQYWTLR
jgi:oligopeptide transport system substrate-binding protein